MSSVSMSIISIKKVFNAGIQTSLQWQGELNKLTTLVSHISACASQM